MDTGMARQHTADVVGDFDIEIAELRRERDELDQEVNRLRDENDSLKQQLNDETYMKLRGEIADLKAQAEAQRQKYIALRDQAFQKEKDLTEQRDGYRSQGEKIAKRLRELEDLLPDEDLEPAPDTVVIAHQPVEPEPVATVEDLEPELTPDTPEVFINDDEKATPDTVATKAGLTIAQMIKKFPEHSNQDFRDWARRPKHGEKKLAALGYRAVKGEDGRKWMFEEIE